MNKYNNYHKHDDKSNIFTPDVNVQEIDYVNRILELGETNNYFTTNHGFGGDIFESRTVCDNNGLHCKFGMEGYIVPNPLEKDNRNYHIILIPKTNVARKKLNIASSHANTEGYYYKPRLFIEDLLKLDPSELYITTACCFGLLADDDSINKIFYPLYEHFGKNLMLEVQAHNEDIQKIINNKAIALSKELGLPLIGACDSHYIYPEQAKERQGLLEGKGMNYGSEDSFLLDYPSYDTMCQRFKDQGILTLKQITDCMEHTLIFDECEDIDIDKTIKMPTIYHDLSEDGKIQLLKTKVTQGFNQMIKDEHLNKEQIELYSKELRKEMKVIEDTNEEIHTADYFLLNKEVYNLASGKYNGVLTKTGRGSCGSFVTNKMLGMTQIDRLSSDLPLYSERFISTARLLENHSMADYDFNCATQEPFIKATRELLGEYECYPMLAYGTMQEGEAFRNVCRSHNLSFDEFNEVGKNINSYRNDKYWKQYIDEAQTYVGTVISCSVHPCSFLLMDKDIREELGILKIGDAYCAPITSGEADAWKYLKNDYLVVTVWDIIKQTFDYIGEPILSIKELEKRLDDKVWSLFADGYTETLNQVCGDWASGLVQRYKPHSVSELAKFVACIRPSFESMREDFIERKPYTNGIKNVDELFKSTDMRVLFQENIMQYFEWLGISPSESIGIIKKISKKKIKPKDFEALEERIKNGWKEKNGTLDGFDKSWADMQSQMKYSFNSPHGLAYAYDCLYCAYLKANYPLEYYTVVLNTYQDNTAKTTKIVEEMKHFGISLGNIAFRHSFDKYGYDKETNTIYKAISSIKNIGKSCADNLYLLKDKHYDTFVDVLYDIWQNKCCNKTELEILIKLDYFSEFGNIKQLLMVNKMFNWFMFGKSGNKPRKTIKKADCNEQIQDIIRKHSEKEAKTQFSGLDNLAICKEVEQLLHYETPPLLKLYYEVKYLGYTNMTVEAPYYAVEAIETNKWGNAFVTLYKVSNGQIQTYKVNKKEWAECKMEQGDIVDCLISSKEKLKKTDDGFVGTGEYEDVIQMFSIKYREKDNKK